MQRSVRLDAPDILIRSPRGGGQGRDLLSHLLAGADGFCKLIGSKKTLWLDLEVGEAAAKISAAQTLLEAVVRDGDFPANIRIEADDQLGVQVVSADMLQRYGNPVGIEAVGSYLEHGPTSYRRLAVQQLVLGSMTQRDYPLPAKAVLDMLPICVDQGSADAAIVAEVAASLGLEELVAPLAAAMATADPSDADVIARSLVKLSSDPAFVGQTINPALQSTDIATIETWASLFAELLKKSTATDSPKNHVLRMAGQQLMKNCWDHIELSDDSVKSLQGLFYFCDESDRDKLELMLSRHASDKVRCQAAERLAEFPSTNRVEVLSAGGKSLYEVSIVVGNTATAGEVTSLLELATRQPKKTTGWLDIYAVTAHVLWVCGQLAGRDWLLSRLEELPGVALQEILWLAEGTTPQQVIEMMRSEGLTAEEDEALLERIDSSRMARLNLQRSAYWPIALLSAANRVTSTDSEGHDLDSPADYEPLVRDRCDATAGLLELLSCDYVDLPQEIQESPDDFPDDLEECQEVILRIVCQNQSIDVLVKYMGAYYDIDPVWEAIEELLRRTKTTQVFRYVWFGDDIMEVFGDVEPLRRFCDRFAILMGSDDGSPDGWQVFRQSLLARIRRAIVTVP